MRQRCLPRSNDLPAGPGDYTDRTSDAWWNKEEQALFSDFSFVLAGCLFTRWMFVGLMVIVWSLWALHKQV